MDFNQLISLELDTAKRLLLEKGYHTEEIEYLNKPPGSLRVVRIQETAAGKVKVLVFFHYDPLKKE